MEIDGTTAAITGAGRGLGAAMARRLATRDAKLALIDCNEESVHRLREELSDSDCLALACDVSREGSVEQAFAAIRERFGRLDVLVNNAGITRDGLLLKHRDGQRVSRLSLKDWQSVIDVNLTGVFLCAREAAELMARSGGGVIINISSISRAGNFGQSNYSAAKAGVMALTVTWARELARHDIRVNAISPGFIDTEMVQAMDPGILERLRSQIPLDRVGQPDDVAQAVEFIISNDFINGRNIEIDGGMRL